MSGIVTQAGMFRKKPSGGGGGGSGDAAILALSPALWLDASDPSTLYDSVTGGNLVGPDGLVARWNDKSGNARHATQATSGRRPQRKVAVKNGKDVVRFSGAAISGGLINLSAMTVFVVWQETSVSSAYPRVFTQRGSGSTLDYNQTGHYIPVIKNSGLYYSSYGGGFQSYYLTVLGQFKITTSKHTGSQYVNYHNNVAATPNAHTLGSNGTQYTLGAASDLSEFSNCDIAEVLVFPYAQSDTDRNAVESILNAKWVVY